MEREQGLQKTSDISDQLLDCLASLGFCPSPKQPREVRSLHFQRPVIHQDALLGLPSTVCLTVQACFNEGLAKVESAVSSAYEGVVRDWRGCSPEDAFDGIGSSFEALYQLQAGQLRQDVVDALNRHRASGRVEISKDNRFRNDVKKVLEEYFEHKPCPTPAEKRLIAETTNLTVKQVTTWFANQRSRKGRVIRKLTRRSDHRASEQLAPAPIIEEPEPRFDATPAQIEGAVTVVGRASPVPSLSSSISSNDSSRVNSIFEMPFESSPTAPAPLEEEDRAHHKAPALPAMITPAELHELFPDVPSGQDFNTVDPFPSDASAFFSSPHQRTKEHQHTDPFAFSATDLNMAAAVTPGVEYWDNLLHTLSEESGTPRESSVEPQQEHLWDEPLQQSQDDWSSETWTEWAMPVLEGFEEQQQQQY